MLHILDGDSSAGTLSRTHITGTKISWREALIDGPAPQNLHGPEWIQVRAQHLTDSYGVDLESCAEDLLGLEQALESSREHEEVVLWFGPDLFCQLNLLWILNWFAGKKENSRLSIVSIDQFPGINDFRCLGQLGAEQLASLFDSRQQLTSRELELGSRAWLAFTSTIPTEVESLLLDDISALPFLKRALQLHLWRFPSVRNGLGRIENRCLELITGGSSSFRDLFLRFGEMEPAYGLGDCQLWRTLTQLSTNAPLLRTRTGELTAERVFETTEAGREVFQGHRDFVNSFGIDRWLGGVHLSGTAGVWRWDEVASRLVQL